MEGLRRLADGIELDLQVVPRSSRDSLGPVHGDRVKLHVTAPPVDGAANDGVRELLAHLFEVPRAQVTIIRGETGRKKTVRLVGEPEQLWARLMALMPELVIASEQLKPVKAMKQVAKRGAPR